MSDIFVDNNVEIYFVDYYRFVLHIFYFEI